MSVNKAMPETNPAPNKSASFLCCWAGVRGVDELFIIIILWLAISPISDLCKVTTIQFITYDVFVLSKF